MKDLNMLQGSLHRLVKLTLDTGEAKSLEEAEQIFERYRLQIVVGRNVLDKPVLQAALLTAVNCATRAFLGGVTVVGALEALKAPKTPSDNVKEAMVELGAQLRQEVALDVPTLVIGDVACTKLEALAVRATYHHWCAGVVPIAHSIQLSEEGDFIPAGVFAGALGVAEIFQRLRANTPMACRRATGLDLWDLGRDWMHGGEAPPLERLPSSVWLVGLGNLGQAYLWTLGLLPYKGQAAQLVLQDFDRLGPSNISTSLLSTHSQLGIPKTRVLANWAKRRGFEVSIVERAFASNFKVAKGEPSVALIGVDNAKARRSIEDVGFERVIEAGLGRGPKDFLGIDVHTFPASRGARSLWPLRARSDGDLSQPAYRAMLEQTKDPCGVVQLASRSVGAPFVGAVAAALVVSELLRLCLGAKRYEMISMHLRDLERRMTISGEPWPVFNPGCVQVAAA